MIIGVLSEQGGSLRNLAASGQAQRFVDQYLARYARHFERVYYFSYADEAPPLPDGCMVIGNRRRWHRCCMRFSSRCFTTAGFASATCCGSCR